MPGSAPMNDPRRCQAKCSPPCVRWSVKASRDATGRGYCHWHGGKRHKRHGVRVDHLPQFFSKHLTKTLEEAVADAMQEDPSEQVAIFEELALFRATVIPAVKMYDAAVSSNAKAETINAAAALLRDQLKDVTMIAQRAAAINSADKVSVHSIKFVVNQIVRIAWEVMGEEHEPLARQFEELVRDRIKVSSDVQGTAITPDMDVTQMDATIPTGEDEDNGSP